MIQVLKHIIAIIIAAGCSLASAQETKKDSSLWQPYYITPRTGAEHIDLSGTWELSHTDKPVAQLKELDKRKEPFQTEVPNSIHWSLYKAGKLAHPYVNKNSSLYSWVDEKAW